VKLVKATTAHDCGFPINPLIVEGQIDGQVSMAQGHALWEEVLMEKGETLTTSFLDYKSLVLKIWLSLNISTSSRRGMKKIFLTTPKKLGRICLRHGRRHRQCGVRCDRGESETLPILPEKILMD